jgi:hypothetical protein
LRPAGWSSPIQKRKATLAKLLRASHEGIAFNQHYDCAGAMIYKHVCALGCEGIVSKRRGSPYRSGRVTHWFDNGPLDRRYRAARPVTKGLSEASAIC